MIKSVKSVTQSERYAGAAGIAQWLERRTRDRKLAGLSPGRSGGKVVLLFFFL